jgi:hypothetical protein
LYGQDFLSASRGPFRVRFQRRSPGDTTLSELRQTKMLFKVGTLSYNWSTIGKTSRSYDNGNVQPGESILTFSELQHAFPYFRSMHSDRSHNRFFDHKDLSHTIYGTTGGQQGDPLEMLRFCATTHPIWARVMNCSPTTQGVAFADDTFLMDSLPQVLHVAADSLKSFRADADLDLQPAKFKIHIKDVSHEHARAHRKMH